jgi:nucleoid-associated protein YgaU
MKPLVLFSGLAIACAGGLLALSYQGWRDDPSVVSSLNQSSSAVPVKTEGGQQQSASSTQPASSGEQQTAAVAPETARSDQASQTPEPDTAQPAQDSAEQKPDTALAPPTFDIVRIERDGSAVMAGRAAPGSKVIALLDGQEIGNAEANERGEWVIVPDSTIAPGDHSITLNQATSNGTQATSDQSVALTVPDTADGQPLIVLSEASKPSRVLQKPEAPAKADAQTTSDPETKVAVVEQQPASEPQQPAGAEQAEQQQDATPQETAKIEQSQPSAEPADTKPATEPAEPAKPVEAAPQPSAPQRQLTVDVVDYDDTGRTTFSGMAQPGSRVRVYVSGRFTGEAQADDAGRWQLTPGREIAAGTHALRADQVAGDGKVVQRIELPFLREQPERIAALQEQRKQEQAATSTAAEQQQQPADTQTQGAPSATEPSEQASAETDAPQPASGTAPETATATGEAATEEEVAAAATTEPATTEETAQAPKKGRVVIQPGNNLWQISRVIYGKGVQYTVIYEANKDQIRNPNLIYPGQIFETPGSQAPESIDPDCRKPLAECATEKQETAQ